MILHICAVYDSAAGSFGRPFAVPARGIAIRSFREEVNRAGDPMNAMFSNPQDFELHEICQFDDQTGFVKQKEGANPTEVLARAFDLKEPS